VARQDADALLVFASGGGQQWLETLAASGKPNLLFVRHKSGPIYLWYEIAHWRLLRKSEDVPREPNLDFDDVVVDDFGEVLWRLRALSGLKNTRGTRMLAVGGLAAYSAPGQQLGPEHARQRWGCDYQTATHEEVTRRLTQLRADAGRMREVNRQTEELLKQPGVKLQTDKKFVVNSIVAAEVFKEMMREAGATNLGVAQCMGGLIPVLDTPPCLTTSLLNDEGLTAYCHADFTHTLPGVLLRWISGKPSFVCNSHFPHDGMVTLAHCAAPRKMDGRHCEPTTIMTHFESDYGAATKVHYRRGQTITCLVPNLRCTKWFGFRGRILDSPAFDICRSQMDVSIEGDWRKLLREMEGFHAVVCYGDYLREVGCALRKVGQLQWENVSQTA
jgi:L-fucose isomerase-like protein